MKETEFRSNNFSIEITNKCNRKCIHCFLKDKKTFLLDYKYLKSIIGEAYMTGFRNLHLTGGEPFLHKDIIAIIEYSYKKGFEYIFINTNGSLLTEKLSKQLNKYKDKLFFSISLHGEEKLHEKISGAGTYKETFDGIQTALKYKFNIDIYSSFGRSLLNEIENYTEFVFNSFSEINNLYFLQLIKTDRNSKFLYNEYITEKEFLEFVRKCIKLKLNRFRINVLDNPLVLLIAKLMNYEWESYSDDTWESDEFIVMADKTINFNHAIDEPFGIYKNKSFKHIDNIVRIKSQEKMINSYCNSCIYNIICDDNMKKHSFMYSNYSSGSPFCSSVLELYFMKNK